MTDNQKLTDKQVDDMVKAAKQRSKDGKIAFDESQFRKQFQRS
jgi:hypothetical protein